jgi:hypothetical protein
MISVLLLFLWFSRLPNNERKSVPNDTYTESVDCGFNWVDVRMLHGYKTQGERGEEREGEEDIKSGGFLTKHAFFLKITQI